MIKGEAQSLVYLNEMTLVRKKDDRIYCTDKNCVLKKPKMSIYTITNFSVAICTWGGNWLFAQ